MMMKTEEGLPLQNGKTENNVLNHKAVKEKYISTLLCGTRVEFNQLLNCGKSPHGFVSSFHRRKIWPILLGIEQSAPRSIKELPLIKKDVARSFILSMDFSSSKKIVLQQKLEQILCALIDRNENINYVQDFLLESFKSGVVPILKLVLNLIRQNNERLYYRLNKFMPNGLLTFTLPWMLTWLSYEITDLETIYRAFDFFICSHPIAPIILKYQDHIMKINQDHLSELHLLFSHIEFTQDFLETVFKEAQEMMKKVEPEKLLLRTKEKLNENSPIVNYKHRVDTKYDKANYFMPWEKKNKSKLFLKKYFSKHNLYW